MRRLSYCLQWLQVRDVAVPERFGSHNEIPCSTPPHILTAKSWFCATSSHPCNQPQTLLMRLTPMPSSLRSACANLQTSSGMLSTLYVRSLMSFPSMQAVRYRSPHVHAYEGLSFTFHKLGQAPHDGRTLHPRQSLPVDAVQLEGVHDGRMRVERGKPHVPHHPRAQSTSDTQDKMVLAQVVSRLLYRPLRDQQSRLRNGFLPLPLRVSI